MICGSNKGGYRSVFRHGNVRLTGHQRKENIMLYYTVVFLVIALVAALLGFTGIAAGSAEIAKILFFIFIILFVISLIMGLMRRK